MGEQPLCTLVQLLVSPSRPRIQSESKPGRGRGALRGSWSSWRISRTSHTLTNRQRGHRDPANCPAAALWLE